MRVRRKRFWLVVSGVVLSAVTFVLAMGVGREQA